MGRVFGTLLLAGILLSLLWAGGPAALEAYRAREAAPTSCSDDIASIAIGTWIRLENCVVDKFRSSGFERSADKAVFTLAPLRGEGYDLEEPTGIALAFRVTDQVSFRPHDDALLYSLAPITGVLAGRMSGIEGTHRESPDFESGITPDAILIEVRGVPESQMPLTLVAGGGVFLVLAALVAFRRRDEDGESAPVVRWGLVAVLLIVSLAASLRSWQSYFDPVRPQEEAAKANAARPPRPPRQPRPPATAPGLPEPTAEQIAALQSADGLERMRAADALMNTAVTPELVAAIDEGLKTKTGEMGRKLVCLKSRVPGPETLEYLLAHFPRDRRSLVWHLDSDHRCMLDALAARIAEDPERIRDALVPGAFSDNGTVRQIVLTAYRTIDTRLPPMEILKGLSSQDPFDFRLAMRAALALGAVKYNRAAVERAANSYDRDIRMTVRHELVTNPHANAARIVTRAWLESPSGSREDEGLARERERAQHDVSAALVEIAKDENEPMAMRVEAVQLMLELDEIGVIPELEMLRPSLAEGALLTAVDETIVHFDRYKRRRHLMRQLTQ